MKLIKAFLYLFIIFSLPVLESCKKILDEPLYSQLAPENFLTTEDGIESVIDAAFAEGYISGYRAHNVQNIENWCTDIDWDTRGGEHRTAIQMINFTWDASIPWMFNSMWQPAYRCIRNANVVLANVDKAEISDDQKSLYKAEARFMRALSYYRLYNWFGPVPLRKSLSDSLALPRATDEEMKTFIESELKAVIPILPFPGTEKNYGRPNQGAAMALLCKFYLNTRQWQKCADMAKEVMDLQYYKLFPSYVDLFKVENERNKEFILVDPQVADGAGNNFINGVFPPEFYKAPSLGITMQSNWNNWGTQYRLYDHFYNSFEPGDKRRDLIISEYINTSGDTVSLLNEDNTRSFKYWPDPNAISNDHGNDVPEIRYADILLSRAEALNEINGPNQKSVDLINEVRNRAGLSDLTVANFPSKDSLNSYLVKARGWEFYDEAGIRREDQIRLGTFISSAIARGHTNAKPYRVSFPIPQAAMDANPRLVQNEGY